MTRPSLDVLLPFHGDVALMQEAVASVRSQDDPDWRLIVVDDHQPDLTVPDWVAGLHDPRIEYHRNPANLGANLNYGKALGLATADLVVFMGADDRMLPDYVRRARDCFTDAPADAAMYQPGVAVIDGEGAPVLPLGDRIKAWLRPDGDGVATHAGEELAVRLLHGNWTYFPSLCWRREAVAEAGFRPGFHVVQDLALILELTATGHAMLVDDRVTFEYRRHAASDSAVKTVTGHRFAEERALFALVGERSRALGWRRAERAARQHLTSRLNALTLLPRTVRQRRTDATRAVLAHALGS